MTGKIKPLRAALPSAMIGLIAGIDNTAAALAIGALMFTGTLSNGMGLGVGVVLLGGALLALIVAIRSVQPNSVALVQESTIAVVAAAIASMAVQSTGDAEAKVATAIVILGASSIVTGVLFWITGKLKWGGLVRYVPYPVMAGFLAGSGWLLVNGASVMLTGHNFGLEFAQSLSDPQVLWRVLPAIVLALVMFVTLSRLSHPVTMPVIMIAALAGFNGLLVFAGLDTEVVRDLGHLPVINMSGGIELPTTQLLAKVDWSAVLEATPVMLVIAGLSMIGLMLNVSGLELAMRRDI
ncbi:MAG: SulP family inorganic anion transporter, partial [Anderseniella sp.]